MTILLVIHTIIVLSLIGIILMQRSTADGLLTGGGDSFLTGRASANMLTRATAFLATLFIANSLLLAYVSTHSGGEESIIDTIENTETIEKIEEKPTLDTTKSAETPLELEETPESSDSLIEEQRPELPITE